MTVSSVASTMALQEKLRLTDACPQPSLFVDSTISRHATWCSNGKHSLYDLSTWNAMCRFPLLICFGSSKARFNGILRTQSRTKRSQVSISLVFRLVQATPTVCFAPTTILPKILFKICKLDANFHHAVHRWHPNKQPHYSMSELSGVQSLNTPIERIPIAVSDLGTTVT